MAHFNNWVALRAASDGEFKNERALVSHIDWNAVQLLFEIVNNHADGLLLIPQALRDSGFVVQSPAPDLATITGIWGEIHG
jgi:hypothetical protein